MPFSALPNPKYTPVVVVAAREAHCSTAQFPMMSHTPLECVGRRGGSSCSFVAGGKDMGIPCKGVDALGMGLLVGVRVLASYV